MNEVEKLLSSIDAAPVVYTNFLENYTKEDCYAFVEGDDDVLFYNSQFQKCNLTKIKIEPTLKSKACLKCLYFTKIISDLCRYLEYFSYLYTINQTE